MPEPLLRGIDGCRAGWLVLSRPDDGNPGPWRQMCATLVPIAEGLAPWLCALLLAAALEPASAGEATAGAAAGPTTGRMTLVRTTRSLPLTGDPIWELHLSLPSQPLRSYEALVGRAGRQEGDRQRRGSQAPLPRGLYQVTQIEPVGEGEDPELGRLVWIGLEPLFPTARKGLGIHHDPSAGRGRRSGTDGCIGLIHGNDLLVLGDLLQRSGTRELEVRD